jgi:hypothetical protein
VVVADIDEHQIWHRNQSIGSQVETSWHSPQVKHKQQIRGVVSGKLEVEGKLKLKFPSHNSTLRPPANNNDGNDECREW